MVAGALSAVAFRKFRFPTQYDDLRFACTLNPGLAALSGGTASVLFAFDETRLLAPYFLSIGLILFVVGLTATVFVLMKTSRS